jgi:hypothetical protein
VAPNFFQVSYIFTGLISGEKKGFFHLNNTIEKYIYFFYLLFLHYISLKSPKLDDYFANNTHRPTYHYSRRKPRYKEIFPGSSAIYFHHQAMKNGETI